MDYIFYVNTGDFPFVFQTDAPLVAVHYEQRGYTPVHCRLPAAAMNEDRGWTHEEVESAVESSMFGWDRPCSMRARRAVARLERAEEARKSQEALAACLRIQARADKIPRPARSAPELVAPYGALPNDNKPGGRDLVGHSSVQAWSAGPIFPAVIARVERYAGLRYTADELKRMHLSTRLLGTYWTLTYPGREDEQYGFYEAAEARARELNARRAAA